MALATATFLPIDDVYCQKERDNTEHFTANRIQPNDSNSAGSRFRSIETGLDEFRSMLNPIVWLEWASSVLE